MADYEQLSDDDLLEQARRCYKLVVDTENAQRTREREDLLFQLPENQWTAEAIAERKGGTFNGIEIQARPMVSVGLLKQPIQLVYNQFIKARLGVNLHPVGENADKAGAERKQGLYRRIERDGGALHARSWAFMRGLVAGRGWYRVNTKYDEDSDPTGPGAWDQEIVFQRILHQESVYIDPSAIEPDFSDAKWALVIGWMSKAQFRKEFPGSRAAKTGSELSGWELISQQAPDWVKAQATDHDEEGVLVAEYWHRDIERQEITDPADPERKRTREIPHVTVYKINGYEVLERQKWDGHWIPLVPVIGEELLPVDGDRMYQGMVRPARGAQMTYNYSLSMALEDMSRLSKAPYVGPVGAFNSDKGKWDSLNVRSYPYVEYDPIDANGNPAPPPQPFPIDGTKMQLSIAMAGQARSDVQSSTAIFEPSLGEMPSKRESQSGRAILALQNQSDAGTSQFTQNLVNITLMAEARIVLDLMPSVYDRPGRVTAIVTGEDETKTMMLGVPFVRDSQGMPQQAQPGQPGTETFDLRSGRYGISVDIGKSNQTRLEAGQQFTAEMAAAYPPLMQFAGDIVFKFRDEPGAKEIAERLRRTIPPNILGEENNAPEQLQAENASLKQQMQQLGQQAQQMADDLKTEAARQQANVQIAAAKSQADVQIAQIKAQSDSHLAEMNNAAKVLMARISSQYDKENQGAEIQEELLSTGLKIQAEADENAKDRAHEVGMAAAGGNTLKVSKTRGQDGEREDSQERSAGSSQENSAETSEAPAGEATE